MKKHFFFLLFIAATSIGKMQAQCNTAVNNDGTQGTQHFLPKYKQTGAPCILNSQVYDNGTTVGINTSTPDANSQFHINLTNSTPGGGTKRALYITTPTSWTPNGSIEAIRATGGQSNTSALAKGNWTAVMGSTSSFSANGAILGGVSGGVSNFSYLLNTHASNISAADGLVGSMACSSLVVSTSSGIGAFVSGVRGWLSGTVTTLSTFCH